ncbi:MAG: hypothetical protein HC888_00605 [Candidatus Competibacteraceae bacterium]|nr:hypothetical protein [Candidatus Competibacteraceae bacterium]
MMMVINAFDVHFDILSNYLTPDQSAMIEKLCYEYAILGDMNRSQELVSIASKMLSEHRSM